MTAAAALSRVAPCVRFPPARAAQRSARASAVSPRGIYALKPIGRSPAYFRKKSHWEEKKSFVVSLFGGGDAKIRIAALEYELDNSRAQSSKLNIEKRAAEAKVVELDDRLQMYVGRIKEAEKDVFKLERQLEAGS